MITDIILLVFFNFILFFLNLLPNFDGLPTNVQTAFDYIHDSLAGVNNFFPLDTLFTITGLVITIELAILTYHLINWIINKVRGSG